MSIEADLVRRYFDAFNAHDVAAVVACFADDAVIVGGDGHDVEGVEAVERHYASTFDRYPDAHCELLHACGSDGTAAAESIFTGTRRGRDRQERYAGAEMLTICDGRISELRDYHSAASR